MLTKKEYQKKDGVYETGLGLSTILACALVCSVPLYSMARQKLDENALSKKYSSCAPVVAYQKMENHLNNIPYDNRTNGITPKPAVVNLEKQLKSMKTNPSIAPYIQETQNSDKNNTKKTGMLLYGSMFFGLLAAFFGILQDTNNLRYDFQRRS